MPTKISELTAITTPVDADEAVIVDDSASATRKITWANIKATLKTYFDTLYAATGDVIDPTAMPFHQTIALGDETTAIASTATDVVSFRAPFAFTLTDIRLSLNSATTTGVMTLDMNESGSTVLSTKLTVDATELTSETAATAAVISDSAIADDALITFDWDGIGDGTATGAKVTIYGTRDVS